MKSRNFSAQPGTQRITTGVLDYEKSDPCNFGKWGMIVSFERNI
jgi:hypothetical protein